jgi:hypothetical protein
LGEAERVIAQTYEEAVPLERLTPSPENINEGDVGAIAESIQTNGFYGSVIAQRSSGTIIAGEHRWRAAQATGGETVPVIWLDVDDEQARRIRLVDNRTTRLGRDDEARLAELLTELAATDLGLAGTGYDGDDLDQLLADTIDSVDDDTDGGKKPIAGIDFRFGDYSGKISRTVYDSFVAQLEARRADDGVVLLDDVLVGWLQL